MSPPSFAHLASSPSSSTSAARSLRARALISGCALVLSGLLGAACADYGAGLCLNQICAAGLYVKLVSGESETLPAGEYTFTIEHAASESTHSWSCTISADDSESVYDCEQLEDVGPELVLDAFVQQTDDEMILWVRTYTGPDGMRRWTGPEALYLDVAHSEGLRSSAEYSPTYEVMQESGCAVCEAAEQTLDISVVDPPEG